MANEQSTLSPPEPAPLSIGKGTAEPGEIVVFIDGHTETAGILEFAGILAREHGSSLISVFMQPEPAATTPEMFARGEGILTCTKRKSRGSRRTTGPSSRTSCVGTESGRSGDRCPT